MPETMQAYRILDWGQAPQLVETAVPEPGPGQVVVKVAGNGLCHSDATMSQLPGDMGEAIGWRGPFTLGPQISGGVSSLGASTTALHPPHPPAPPSPQPPRT